jgi:hypothetical protein
MSQDAFEVLVHCLALDPEKRDLNLVRDAIDRVISFTTDDEALDEFCTEEREPIVASANREPLRTPSVSTPQLDQNGSFPWAKALAMSPPQPIRQLSAIPDTEVYDEDMYPSYSRSNNGWFDVKPDNASTVSFVDSGLGLSFKSTDLAISESSRFMRSRPMPISGSLPASAAIPFKSMASVFGKKRDAISKSWSDLWDEEEEEATITDTENDYVPVAALNKEKLNSSESGSGVSTPRAGLSELKNPATVHNSRSRSPKDNRRAAEHVSEHTGFVFEEHHAPRYSPPSKRTIADKWAALGDRRRGPQPVTPKKTIRSPKQAQPTTASARKRSRTDSWRRPINWGPSQQENGGWERKDNWNAIKDWRHNTSHAHDDDMGDLEWVGGWE